jgi:hypothetical protein
LLLRAPEVVVSKHLALLEFFEANSARILGAMTLKADQTLEIETRNKNSERLDFRFIKEKVK